VIQWEIWGCFSQQFTNFSIYWCNSVRNVFDCCWCTLTALFEICNHFSSMGSTMVQETIYLATILKCQPFQIVVPIPTFHSHCVFLNFYSYLLNLYEKFLICLFLLPKHFLLKIPVSRYHFMVLQNGRKLSWCDKGCVNMHTQSIKYQILLNYTGLLRRWPNLGDWN